MSAIKVDWHLNRDGKPEVLVQLTDLRRQVALSPEQAQKVIEDLMRAKADSLFAASVKATRVVLDEDQSYGWDAPSGTILPPKKKGGR